MKKKKIQKPGLPKWFTVEYVKNYVFSEPDPESPGFNEARRLCIDFLDNHAEMVLWDAPLDRKIEIMEILENAKKVKNLEELNIVMYDVGSILLYLSAFDFALQFFTNMLKTAPSKRDAGVSIGLIGIVLWNKMNLELALECYHKNLQITREVVDRKNEGAILINIAMVYRQQKRYSLALGHLNESLKIYREIEDKYGEGTTLDIIGHVYEMQGNLSESLSYQEKALEIWNKFVPSRNLNEIDPGTGLPKWFTVEYVKKYVFSEPDPESPGFEEARRFCIDFLDNHAERVLVDAPLEKKMEILEILDEVKQVKNFEELHYAMHVVGVKLCDLSEYVFALQFFAKRLKIAPSKRDAGVSIATIGNILCDKMDLELALECYQKYLQFTRENGDRKEEGTALNNIAVVYKEQKRYSLALEHLEESLKIDREVGDKKGEGTKLANIGQVYLDQEKLSESLSYHAKALEIWNEIGDKRGKGVALHDMAVVYKKQGKFSSAMEMFERSLPIDREIGDRDGEATTLCNLAILCESMKDIKKCLKYVEESTKIYKRIGLDHRVKRLEDYWKGIEAKYEHKMIELVGSKMKSTKLKDYQVIEKIGVNEKKTGGQEGRAIVMKCKLGNFEEDFCFAMKIVLNYNTQIYYYREVKERTIKDDIIPVERLPKHPNVMSILHYFIDTVSRETIKDPEVMEKFEETFVNEKTGFLVTPLYKQSLLTYFKEPKFLSEYEFLLIAEGILHGLCHLYENKIVHRDIKPDNIMLTERMNVIIIDFGEHLDAAELENFQLPLPKTVSRGGAVYYLPPEILSPDPGEDSFLDYSKSDDFGAGLVLFWMMSGGKKDAYPLWEAKLDENFVGIGDDWPYSNELKEIVRGMCYCDMEKRMDCYEAGNLVGEMVEKKKKELMKTI